MKALQTCLRCVLPLVALGASAAPEGFHLRLHAENDMGISDVNYTNGLRLETGWSGASLPPWLGWMDWLYTAEAASRTFGFVAAQNMYTPTNIQEPDLTPELLEARPYAGWMYAGIYVFSFDPGPGTALSVELDVGWLGEALGGATQRWWHAQPFVNAPIPQGWAHHVGDEVGFRLMLGWRQRLWQMGPAGRPLIDIWSQVRAEGGNVFTAAAAGALFRVGWLSSIPPGDTMPAVRSSDPSPSPFELYLYVRLEEKLVVYNGTLQGGWLTRSPHTVRPRPFVTAGDWGAHLSVFGLFLEVGRVYKSSEVRTLTGDPFGHSYWQAQVGKSI